MSSPTSMERSDEKVPASAGASDKVWLLAVLCLLGLALKVLEIWMSPEIFMDWEEFSRGLLAREMLDGPAYRLMDYQGDPYAGGSLLMGILAIPLFAILGDSLFVLKLVTLPFLLGTALAAWLLIRRHLDRRAALLVPLLFFLPPYPSSRLSLVAWGDNVQVPLFIFLVLILLQALLHAQGRSWWRALSLGLVAGFGVYYHYHTALPLALIALLALGWERRRLPARSLALVFLGFCLGFSPWLVYNLGHGWEALNISAYGSVAQAGQGIAARYPMRLLSLLTWVPAASLGPGPAMWSWALCFSVLAWLVFLGCWGFLVAREWSFLRILPRALLAGRLPSGSDGSWLLLFFLFYPLFFAIVAAALPYSFENKPAWYFADRYLASLHGCVFVLVSLAAVDLWGRGSWSRLLGASAWGLFLAIGVAAQLVILFGNPPVQPQSARDERGGWIRAWDYSLLSDERVAFAFYKGDLANNLEVIAHAQGPRRSHLARALGMSLVYHERGGPLHLAAILEQEGGLASQDRRFTWEGIGYGVGRWRSDELQGSLAELRKLDEEDLFLRGLMGSLSWWYEGQAPSRVVETITQSVPEPWRDRFLVQFGQELSVNSKRELGRVLLTLREAVPQASQAQVAQGICLDLRPRMRDPVTTAQVLEDLAAEPDPLLRERIRACLTGPPLPQKHGGAPMSGSPP